MIITEMSRFILVTFPKTGSLRDGDQFVLGPFDDYEHAQRFIDAYNERWAQEPATRKFHKKEMSVVYHRPHETKWGPSDVNGVSFAEEEIQLAIKNYQESP